jgi:hypothetical protein
MLAPPFFAHYGKICQKVTNYQMETMKKNKDKAKSKAWRWLWARRSATLGFRAARGDADIVLTPIVRVSCGS